MNELEQQIMNAQARQQLDATLLANNPRVAPGKVWNAGLIDKYKSGDTSLYMHLREISNGYILETGGKAVFIKELTAVGDEILKAWAALALDREK